MPLKIGEVVHYPVWDTVHGFYIESYKVLAREGSMLKLEHIGTAYRGERYAAGSFIVRYLLETEFDAPLSERAQKISDEARMLIEQFNSNNYPDS